MGLTPKSELQDIGNHIEQVADIQLQSVAHPGKPFRLFPVEEHIRNMGELFRIVPAF